MRAHGNLGMCLLSYYWNKDSQTLGLLPLVELFARHASIEQRDFG